MSSLEIEKQRAYICEKKLYCLFEQLASKALSERPTNILAFLREQLVNIEEKENCESNSGDGDHQKKKVCDDDDDDPVEKILSQYIVTGLYQNEPKEAWPLFLEKMDVLFREAVDSPRSQIVQLMLSDQHFQEEISYHFLAQKTGIKREETKNEQEMVSHKEEKQKVDSLSSLRQNIVLLQSETEKLFPQENKLKSVYEKQAALVQNLEDKNSEEYKKIFTQVTQFSKTTSFDEILEAKILKLKETEVQYEEMLMKHQDTGEYKRYEKFCLMVKQYRQAWDDCNKAIGEENIEKGSSLEQQITPIEECLQERFSNSDKNGKAESSSFRPIKFWKNRFWNDKLGEVDLLFQYSFGYVIVECKARVHDVMSGWLQNGPQRNSRKKSLYLDDMQGWVSIPFDAPMFVVTTLPENTFMIPCESLVKRVISYKLKHECSAGEAWQYAQTIFEPNRITPIEWYRQGGKEHVIVI